MVKNGIKSIQKKFQYFYLLIYFGVLQFNVLSFIKEVKISFIIMIIYQMNLEMNIIAYLNNFILNIKKNGNKMN